MSGNIKGQIGKARGTGSVRDTRWITIHPLAVEVVTEKCFGFTFEHKEDLVWLPKSVVNLFDRDNQRIDQFGIESVDGLNLQDLTVKAADWIVEREALENA